MFQTEFGFAAFAINELGHEFIGPEGTTRLIYAFNFRTNEAFSRKNCIYHLQYLQIIAHFTPHMFNTSKISSI